MIYSYSDYIIISDEVLLYNHYNYILYNTRLYQTYKYTI